MRNESDEPNNEKRVDDTKKSGGCTNDLASTICEFEKDINLIIENFPLKKLERILNPVEYADFNTFLAYATCSLFYSYLKISGDVLDKHPIKEEIQRVQNLMKEIKQQNGKSNRTTTINKEAANRIIRSCMLHNQNINKRMKQNE